MSFFVVKVFQDKKSGISGEHHMIGRIHSYETLGAVDGPGIRFVLFMQGCRLRCKYCHNPDSWSPSCGKEMSDTEIADEVVKYRHYFGRKGGITVSGGEPLLQLDFLISLFTLLKQRGISTAIDTSGAEYNENDERYGKLLSVTDLVLLDIKHIDTNKCKALTGIGNENTLAFARRLSKENIPVIIRQVLVPSLTDDRHDLIRTRDFIATLDNVKKIEVLPYHTLGRSKYENMGIPYALDGVTPPAKETVAMANEILSGALKNQ